MRYILIYVTVSQNPHTCFELFGFYVLIFLLNLDIRRKINNQNEAVLMHYKVGQKANGVRKLFLQ